MCGHEMIRSTHDCTKFGRASSGKMPVSCQPDLKCYKLSNCYNDVNFSQILAMLEMWLAWLKTGIFPLLRALPVETACCHGPAIKALNCCVVYQYA